MLTKKILTVFLIFIIADGVFALDRSHISFYCSFDKSPVADFSKGKPDPLDITAEFEFTDGITGKGILIRNGRITYPYTGNMNNQEGTVSFWMKPAGWKSADIKTGQYNFFYVNGSPAMQITYVYWGVTRFYIYYPGEKISANACKYYAFDKERWYHIAASWKSGKEIKFFINSTLISRITDNVPEVVSGINFSIGAPMTIFDEMIIFNRFLKDKEITAIFLRNLK
ncbi:MAG: LamG domain-containing protein [Candidatus Omnitrophica bacterium]|nr:LamG domain-containing protein [Candidatus Omnitrophota bacterium]MCM8776777.1 LamG domain-containing protein [Candidatus Omnitrophota bacterium]